MRYKYLSRNITQKKREDKPDRSRYRSGKEHHISRSVQRMDVYRKSEIIFGPFR